MIIKLNEFFDLRELISESAYMNLCRLLRLLTFIREKSKMLGFVRDYARQLYAIGLRRVEDITLTPTWLHIDCIAWLATNCIEWLTKNTKHFVLIQTKFQSN